MKIVSKIVANIDNIIKYLGVFGIYFSVFIVAVGIAGWIGDYHYAGWEVFVACLLYAIAIFFSSLPVIGLAHIVKAAMFYLKQNGQLPSSDNEGEDMQDVTNMQ